MSEAKVEFVEAYRRNKCGKSFGRSNTIYKGMEVWLSCDCQPQGIMYFLNTNNLKEVLLKGINFKTVEIVEL